MNSGNQIVAPGNQEGITGINKKVRCKGTHPYISNLLNDIDVHPSDVRTCTILAFEAGDDMPVLLFCGSSKHLKKNQTSPAIIL